MYVSIHLQVSYCYIENAYSHLSILNPFIAIFGAPEDKYVRPDNVFTLSKGYTMN